MKVEGTVAIVTGAAMGMGKGFAEALLKAGASVCIADYNEEAGQATTTELSDSYGNDRVIFCKCNVVSQDEFKSVFEKTKEKFGRLDIVVNNAGVGGESDDAWERSIDVNVKGTLRGIRLAMHYLSKENGGTGGAIVNMASAAGLNPNPFSPVYCSTKAAIIQATRCYAISKEAASSGIRISVLCPAFVDTPMLRNLSQGDKSQVIDDDAEKVKAFVQHVGIMTVEDISALFMDLVTDDTKNGSIMWCSKNGGNKYCSIKIEDIE